MNKEFREAFVRGLIHAGFVSTTMFLTYWTDPSLSWKTLISITVQPGLMILGTRVLGEGWLDTVKKTRPQGPGPGA